MLLLFLKYEGNFIKHWKSVSGWLRNKDKDS